MCQKIRNGNGETTVSIPSVIPPIFEAREDGSVALHVRPTTTGNALRSILTEALRSNGFVNESAHENQEEVEDDGIELSRDDLPFAYNGLKTWVDRRNPDLKTRTLVRIEQNDQGFPVPEYVKKPDGSFPINHAELAEQMLRELGAIVNGRSTISHT